VNRRFGSYSRPLAQLSWHCLAGGLSALEAGDGRLMARTMTSAVPDSAPLDVSEGATTTVMLDRCRRNVRCAQSGLIMPDLDLTRTPRQPKRPRGRTKHQGRAYLASSVPKRCLPPKTCINVDLVFGVADADIAVDPRCLSKTIELQVSACAARAPE